MDDLRGWVAHVLTAAFVGLLGADAIDDIAFANQWPGPPKEMFALMSILIGGLFAAEVLRRRNGNGHNGQNGKGVKT